MSSKEPIGSVAEEAAKLFAVLQQAAAGPGGTTRAEPAPADEEQETHEHHAGPECQWCPVCQLIRKVRNTSPETIEQLSSAAAHVLGSVRSLLEAAAEAGPADAGGRSVAYRSGGAGPVPGGPDRRE